MSKQQSVFRITSRTVIARRSGSGKRWVLVCRRPHDWCDYSGMPFGSVEEAALHGVPMTKGRLLDRLYWDLDSQENEAPDWRQVRAALGEAATLWLAFERGAGSVIAAGRVLRLEVVVEEAIRRGKTDLLDELCADRTLDELVPVLASAHPAARYAAQLALGS